MESESGRTTPDLDKTDELPVLSEEAIVAAGGEYPEFARELEDEVGAAPAQPAGAEPSEEARAPSEEPEDSTTGELHAVENLGRDIAQLTARWSGLEGVLEANAMAIATLQSELAESRRDLRESQAKYQTLLTELANRPDRPSGVTNDLARARARQDELGDELVRVRERQQELEVELGRAQARAKELETRLGASQARAKELETALESARAALSEHDATATKPDPDLLLPYLDRIEALEGYIAGRHDRWQEMEGTVASQAETIRELERELAHRVERQHALERRIHDEARVTERLRAELAELSAAYDDSQRQAAAPGRGPELSAALTAANTELEQARAELTRLERKLIDVTESTQPTPVVPEAAEAEHAAESDQTVVAMDRTPKAREPEPAAIEPPVLKPAAIEPPVLEPPVPRPPVLVCLTSDEPVRYVLDRSELRIGRGSDCDIRIDTHFVSREHAGLVRDNGRTVIEDRDSTNGVFVNAVRVDRKELEHGDWVTIGETQFRYLSEEA